MFSMLRKKDGAFIDGCAKMFDSYEQALDILEDKSIDADSVLHLYWIYGHNNQLVAEAERGLITWAMDSWHITEFGWSGGEFKCPLCGTMFGKNLKGQLPFALVREHLVQKHH